MTSCRLVAVALSLCLVLPPAYALPEGEAIENGDVSFERPDEATLNITASDQAIISWESFSIAAHETLNFFQPSFQASVLNHVWGGSVSEILGKLNANGRVFLENPSGIIFGPAASVHVGSLIASTLHIDNQDFLAGRLSFIEELDDVPSFVINQGHLVAREGGSIALLGGAVENTGVIEAKLGSVQLAAGERMTLSFATNGLISVVVDKGLEQSVTNTQGTPFADAVRNAGEIKTDGGNVKMTAEAVSNVFDRLVNQEGIIEAQSVVEREGVIELVGSSGLVRNAGSLRADGTAENPDGGSIRMSGEWIVQRGEISANAADHGTAGDVRIISTTGTLLTTGSVTQAKGAAVESQGGNVIINSLQGNTEFRSGALIDVSGGSVSGDAGFIDISAHENLGVDGQLLGLAQAGYQGGRLLFDPLRIRIRIVGTNAVSGGDAAIGIADETFTEDPGATLSFNPAAGGAFAGFQQIFLQATQDILIESPLDVPTAVGGAGIASLRLEAGRDVLVQQNLSTSGQNIELVAGRNVSISSSRSITITGAGNLTITADAVVNGVASNGAGTFSMGSGSSITTGGGNISITGADDMNIRTINAGAGNVNITGNSSGTDIFDDSNNATKITANILTINNVGLIGSSGGTGQLDTSVNQLNATTTLGSIFVTNDKALIANTVTAGGGSSDITLVTSIGDLTLGAITAADDMTLTAAGAIVAQGSLLTGDLATLTAGTNIGAAGAPVNFAVNSWSLNTTSGSAHANVTSGNLTINTQANAAGVSTFGTTKGNVRVNQAAGSLTLQTAGNLTSTANLNLPGGNIALGAGGNISLNAITAGGAVNLTAGGNILDTNGALNNITAAADSTLMAGGTIGSAANPLEVIVTGATLGVSALGQTAGISAAINGAVTPSGTLLVLGAPPGAVLFNGIDVRPPAVLSVGAGATTLGNDLLFSPFLEPILEPFLSRRMRGFIE